MGYSITRWFKVIGKQSNPTAAKPPRKLTPFEKAFIDAYLAEQRPKGDRIQNAPARVSEVRDAPRR